MQWNHRQEETWALFLARRAVAIELYGVFVRGISSDRERKRDHGPGKTMKQSTPVHLSPLVDNNGICST